MPFKLDAEHRHHVLKPRYRVTNRADYDAALRQRGSLTVWFADDAIAAWRAEPRITPSGQPHYSALAITTALTMRAVLHLALRQIEGLIGSTIGYGRRSLVKTTMDCYKALRTLSGVAPVTKRSGKSCVVVMRYAAHARLREAVFQWARVAVQNDPKSKRRYEALRARGHSYGRALRGVADRMLGVACVLLERRELFDPQHGVTTLTA